jgi:hypothetical protein
MYEIASVFVELSTGVTLCPGKMKLPKHYAMKAYGGVDV